MSEEVLGQVEEQPEVDQATMEANQLTSLFAPKEEAEVVVPEAPVVEEKKAAEVVYYTQEEIEAGIEKLDPNRIHPELRPFYKSMLKDYTQKTMKLAEEQRKAKEESTPRQAEEPPEVKAQKRAAELKREFKNAYGIDYELWNEDHQVLMAEFIAGNKVTQDKTQTEYSAAVEKWTELQATVSSDPQILQFALQKVSSLITNDETMRKGLNLSASLDKAISNPNSLTPKEVNELHRFMQTEIKKDYFAEKAKPKEPKPTVLDSSGTPAPKIERKLSAKDIQNMDADAQSMLLSRFSLGK